MIINKKQKLTFLYEQLEDLQRKYQNHKLTYGNEEDPYVEEQIEIIEAIIKDVGEAKEQL